MEQIPISKVKQPSANLLLSRYDFAANRLREIGATLPSFVVFDVGAGGGQLRKIESDGFKWHGFDLNPGDDIAKWDLTHPCPVTDRRAGAVLLLDVIEHCVNPGLALRNISAAMEPNGKLILTTPNLRWSGSRAHMLFRGLASGFTPLDLWQNHHVFPAWPHVLEKMLGDAGFQIEEYVTLDGWTSLFSRPGNMFPPSRYVLNLFLIAIERLDPAARGMSCGLIARKI